MQPIFKMMVDYLRRPVAHEAFFKKYASKKFLKGKSSLTLPVLVDIVDRVTSFDTCSSMGQEEL